MFIVNKSTSKAGTNCGWGGGGDRGSQYLLLVDPQQKQVQTVGRGGGRGSSQCLLLVNPHQKQVGAYLTQPKL